MTETLQQTLNHLKRFFRQNKYLPSTRELAESLGYGAKSKTQVLRILTQLVEGNYLDQTDNGKYIPGSNFFAYRLFHGVQAGTPSAATDEFEPFELDSYVVEDPEQTMFVSVEGESMLEAGILPGDVVAVKQTKSVKPGEMVVVAIDGAFTVKYLDHNGAQYFLRPANPKFSNIEFSGEQEVSVVGRVTGVMRKVT